VEGSEKESMSFDFLILEYNKTPKGPKESMTSSLKEY
jgi:hypothetical protein